MEFFRKKTEIDFMAQRKWAAILSITLFILSIVALLNQGLNWGLDFTGGTQLEIRFPQTADLSQIRNQLVQAGFKEPVVQSYGTARDVLIKLAPRKDLNQQNLTSQIQGLLPQAELHRVEYVGPQVGQELATKGAMAVVVALIGTMIYIAIRFEYRFAVSAAVALIHDPILILGLFALLHLEFNLTALAAVLAVIGYSLNDTIVIYDRIRENFRKMRKGSSVEVVNLSINQTLSRTIMTSVMTLLVVLALFFLGGEMIHSFATALIIGICVGTYSSIYVAGALAVALGLNKHDLMPRQKEALDDLP
jgi:preprotein translocase subunit SecF